MDVDAISKYELEAVDRASAELVLIRVLLCKLMVWDVSDGGVKAGEVSTHFRVRYRARPIQGNLKTDEVVVNVGRSKGRHKKKLFFFLQKNSERGAGGLAESEISLSEKNEIFLEKGGASPIPKGCYHKKKLGIFGYFLPKGGVQSMGGVQSIGISS